MEKFVDISGADLNIGDKVAVQYQQLFRIGQITGFKNKKVIVAFDFTTGINEEITSPEHLDYVNLYPWRLAKVANQEIGLRDYYKFIQK